MSTPYNSIRLHLNLKSLTEPSDARDLSDVMIAVRTQTEIEPGFGSHLDNEEVAELIRVAFAASCRAEEGSYPRFRLFAYSSAAQEDQLRTVAAFQEPVSISVDNIRKLVEQALGDSSSVVPRESSTR